MPSHYHLVRFVLEVALPDHIQHCNMGANREMQWSRWYERVCAIFPRREPPDALLRGIMRVASDAPDADTLLSLCQESLEKSAARRGCFEERKSAWMHRRDEGNSRVAIARLAARPKGDDANEQEIERMLPVWDKQYENILFNRHAEVRDIFQRRDRELSKD
jgi:hypothetical protein